MLAPQKASNGTDFSTPACEVNSVSRYLAVVSFMNGSATALQTEAALDAAKRFGVTTSQYLRARLLLRAGILTDVGTAMTIAERRRVGDRLLRVAARGGHHVNPLHDEATKFATPCTSELTLLLSRLASDARSSESAFNLVHELYRMAATGEWQPRLVDLNTLVYAPLNNPSLIPEIEGDVERILAGHPAQSQLRSGWSYVQSFSPNAKRRW